MIGFINELQNLIYATFILENRWRFFLEGLQMTILLTVTSFVFGSLLGAGFCAMKMSKRPGIRKIANAVISFLVQLPTLVILMLFVYLIFGSVPISAVIIVIFGLTLKAGSYLADIFYTAITAVNKGEVEAAYTLGFNKIQTFFYVIFPQALNMGLPVYKNQFIITMQETSIVGYLAIMDLTRASDIITSRTLNALFGLLVISILYLLLGWIGGKCLDLLSHKKHLEVF